MNDFLLFLSLIAGAVVAFYIVDIAAYHYVQRFSEPKTLPAVYQWIKNLKGKFK